MLACRQSGSWLAASDWQVLPGWLLGWHHTLLVLRRSLCPCLPGCSWGSTWGNTGFIDIAMDFEGHGMCGMYKHAFYPNTPVGLDGPQPPLPPLPDPMFSANFRPYPASVVRWSSWSGWTWSPSGAVTADLLCPCKPHRMVCGYFQRCSPDRFAKFTAACRRAICVWLVCANRHQPSLHVHRNT